MQNNSNSRRPVIAVRHGEKGFTLLEVIVSMVIFLIVTGAIYGTLRVAQNSRSVVNEQVQLTKNLRLALNVVGRDTYNAGFGYPVENTVILPDNKISTLIGIPNDADTTRDTIPPIITGNNITVNNLNGVAGAAMDQVTFLYKDSTFNLVGAAGKEVSQPLYINAAETNSSGIDEIIPVSGSNTVCRVNDIYLIMGANSQTLGLSTALSGTNKIQFANSDVLGFNLSGASGNITKITTPASIQRVKLVTYFVTTDGILTRREFANTTPVTPAVAFVDEPLVYGVENFQIQYVMDDGTISNNPSAGTDGVAGTNDDDQANLMKVRQVRYTVDVRSTERNAAGQFYRATMTSTFSTRNLGYDAN